MGKAIVATAQVSDVSELTLPIENLQFGDSSYYLLQRPDDITNWKKGMPDGKKIEEYTHGRIFDKNGELRWQKSKGGYSLLWLSEGDLPEGFTALGECEWETHAPQDVFLLGGGDTSEWRDTRIPRELDYPIGKCRYPSVKVIQYKDRDSQTIRFTRYTAFVGKQGD